MFPKLDIDVLADNANRQAVEIIDHGDCAPLQSGKEHWHPATWRQFPASQQPKYADENSLQHYEQLLRLSPPLVLATEVRHFRQQLEHVFEGKSFFLQGGDCAESFDNCQAIKIRDMALTITQMAGLIHSATGLPVLNVGRIAGQYGKPRSQQDEVCDNVSLPSFRGLCINGPEFSIQERLPDPNRMLLAYHYSASTINLLRAMTKQILPEYPKQSSNELNLGEVNSHEQILHEHLRISYDKYVREYYASRQLFTSHEALLLNYEETMTRRDTIDGLWYNCSANMLWLGERTGAPHEAHVEYLRGIENPVGIKCGPSMNPERLLLLLTAINPGKKPGKVILIARMGCDYINKGLPPLLRAVKMSDYPVVWVVDPMHGNTRTTSLGYKTRDFSCIEKETLLFIMILKKEEMHPGGIHIEMTGEEVTECTGGLQRIGEDDLPSNYLTLCDPRLNRTQSLELAFLVGTALSKKGD